MPRRNVLVIMVKAPVAGRVKTRLGKDIGMTMAAWWFRHQSRRTMRTLRDPRWQMVAAVTPDRDVAKPFWPEEIARTAQGRGDLGVRMLRLFRRFAVDNCLIVGADVPDIHRADLACAFDLLGRNDAVFGPATDGGYWLVGMGSRLASQPGTFRNVRWSSEHALADSVASLGNARIGYVRTLSDVDHAADLNRCAN